MLSLLFAIFAFSETSLAEEKSVLDPFVEETETLAEESRSALIKIQGEAEEKRKRKISGAKLHRQNLDSFPGRVRELLRPLVSSLGADTCQLPPRSKVALTVAELNFLLAEAEQSKKQLKEEKSELRPIIDPAEFARMELRFQLYVENTRELRDWLLTSQVYGLTREKIARRPACAGKVLAAASLIPGANQSEAEPGARDLASGRKVRIDLDIKDISGLAE